MSLDISLNRIGSDCVDKANSGLNSRADNPFRSLTDGRVMATRVGTYNAKVLLSAGVDRPVMPQFVSMAESLLMVLHFVDF